MHRAWWHDQGGNSLSFYFFTPSAPTGSSMLSRAKLLLIGGFSVLLIDLQGHARLRRRRSLGSRESPTSGWRSSWSSAPCPRRSGFIGCSLAEQPSCSPSTLRLRRPGFSKPCIPSCRRRQEENPHQSGAAAPVLARSCLSCFRLGCTSAAGPRAIRSIARLGYRSLWSLAHTTSTQPSLSPKSSSVRRSAKGPCGW